MSWPRLGRRRILSLGVGLCAILGIVWFVGPLAATPIVRAKLQAMIAQQLDAELAMGRVTYLPPYGVRVDDARLTAIDRDSGGGGRVDLLVAKRVELRLAELPLGDGPLVINALSIEEPLVHVIRTSSGIVGRNVARRQTTEPAEPRRRKLSEMFELRKVRLAGGSVMYDDRTAAGAVPLVWRGLNLDLDIAPTTAAEYGFDVRAGDGRVGQIAAAGSFHLDDLLLTIDRCQLRATVDPRSDDSPLPSQLQRVLRDYAVSGELRVDSAGQVPLAAPAEARLVTTLDLPRATGRLPEGAAPLDEVSFRLTCSTEPAPRPAKSTDPVRPLVKVTIDYLIARGGDTRVAIDGGTAIVNGVSRAWGVSDLHLVMETGTTRAALPARLRDALADLNVAGGVACTVSGSGPLADPRDAIHDLQADLRVIPAGVSFRPAVFPEPFHDFGEVTARLGAGVVTVENVRACYGGDVVFVREAAIRLADLPGSLRFEHLAGAVTFGTTPPAYPAAIANVMSHVQPRGPFFAEGTACVDVSPRNAAEAGAAQHDYRLRVTTERAAISTWKRRIPLHNVRGDVLVTPAAVEVRRLDADALSGTVHTVGRVDLKPSLAYAAQTRLRRVDLNSLANAFVPPDGEPVTVSGEISADFDVTTAGTGGEMLDGLRAEGALEIARGELFHIPTLREIVRTVNLERTATVSEAACRFDVAGRRVRLTDLAVGAPALGIQGGGTVGFDGALDLQVITTAFNDWDAHIRRDDNPVANVAATIAGGVQRGLDRATKELVYRLHVGGRVGEPDVKVIAAPALQRASRR